MLNIFHYSLTFWPPWLQVLFELSLPSNNVRVTFIRIRFDYYAFQSSTSIDSLTLMAKGRSTSHELFVKPFMNFPLHLIPVTSPTYTYSLDPSQPPFLRPIYMESNIISTILTPLSTLLLLYFSHRNLTCSGAVLG